MTGIKPKFRVGDRVICIDAEKSDTLKHGDVGVVVDPACGITGFILVKIGRRIPMSYLESRWDFGPRPMEDTRDYLSTITGEV